MISIRSLSKSFGSHRVLQDFSLDIERGETVVLLGPSGSGKSTLLRCVIGLERFDRGEIEVDSITLRPDDPHAGRKEKLKQVRERCGMVFQQFHLFPHMSVEQNLMLAPIHVLKNSRTEAQQDALTLLDQVGLARAAEKRPSQLSGGEQQRVAIARALAMHPAYLLYDEPTSNLDADRAREIWRIMHSLSQAGQTQIIVTHQEELARSIPSRVVRMPLLHAPIQRTEP